MRGVKTVWEARLLRARPSAALKRIGNGADLVFDRKRLEFRLSFTLPVPNLHFTAAIFLEISLIQYCTIALLIAVISGLTCKRGERSILLY